MPKQKKGIRGRKEKNPSKARKDWFIIKHAIKRFQKRFLRRKRTLQEIFLPELYGFLRRAALYAQDPNPNDPADIYLFSSNEYGEIYFVTKNKVVCSVYTANMARKRIETGKWKKVK